MPATPADAMTYEETVHWLRRYQESLRQEQELAKEVEQLQSEACRMTPLLSGMPGGGSDGQGLPRAADRTGRACPGPWSASWQPSRTCRPRLSGAAPSAGR